MVTHKLSLSFCVGDFYLLGKIDTKNITIEKKGTEYIIAYKMNEEDIRRFDDPKLINTLVEAKSNVIQVDFTTGEKNWI